MGRDQRLAGSLLAQRLLPLTDSSQAGSGAERSRGSRKRGRSAQAQAGEGGRGPEHPEPDLQPSFPSRSPAPQQELE